MRHLFSALRLLYLFIILKQYNKYSKFILNILITQTIVLIIKQFLL